MLPYTMEMMQNSVTEIQNVGGGGGVTTLEKTKTKTLTYSKQQPRCSVARNVMIQ